MTTALIALFFIGLGLALTGGAIGIFQAFQTSAVWGLLYLLCSLCVSGICCQILESLMGAKFFVFNFGRGGFIDCCGPL
jgi:uncharacterized membrane protein (DUF106 family)